MQKIKTLKNKLFATKVKVTGAVMLGLTALAPTLCAPSTGIAAIDNLTKLIMNIMKVVGYILTALGVGMLVKAVIASQNGQEQSGAIPKAAATAFSGIVLVAIELVLGIIGV